MTIERHRTRRERRAHPCPHGERGAALVISLAVLFILSVLGVSTMRGSIMERRMTENAIQSATVLQVAESASEFALADATNLRDAFALNGTPLVLELDVNATAETTAVASMRYTGEGVALGYSLGSGSGNFVSLQYESRGDATIDAVRAYRGVTQGAWRVVPAAQ